VLNKEKEEPGGESSSVKKLYIWVKNPASGAGIPGATVSFTVKTWNGTATYTGTTNSSGYMEWTNLDLPPNQYATATVTAPSGYYWYTTSGTRYSTDSCSMYINGSSYGTTFTLSNTGIITGLTSQYSELKFYAVGQTRSTRMDVAGAYSQTVNVGYDKTDVDGRYRGWSSVSTLSSSPGSYTLTGKCLKWAPASGISFTPSAYTLNLIARSGSTASIESKQASVTFRQYA